MNSNSNNRWLYLIVLLLITANIFTLVLLWIHKPQHENNLMPPPNEGGPVFEFVTKELQLDSAQKEMYAQLRNQHQARQRILLDSIKEEKDVFFALLKNKNITEQQLQMQSSKVAVAEQQLDLFTFKHFQKLRTICTAQQQNKFDKIIEQVLHQMANNKRPQGPPPPHLHDDKMPPPDNWDMPDANRPPPPEK